MENEYPRILVVGGANTGRSPIAEAILKKLLTNRNLEWAVESAGIIGHDNEYAEPEAISAMYALDMDITEHSARSLTDTMIRNATILVAIDSGTVYAVRMRFPLSARKTISLGQLAGVQRDIPDPFRMQVATWISYAREIEGLVKLGLDSLISFSQQLHAGELRVLPGTEKYVTEEEAPPPEAYDTQTPHDSNPTNSENLHAILQDDQEDAEDPSIAPERLAAIERCMHLLTVMREMPTLVKWEDAQQQLTTELKAAAIVSSQRGDMIQTYANLLLAMLTMIPSMPQRATIEQLEQAIAHMRHHISQEMVRELSLIVADWD